MKRMLALLVAAALAVALSAGPLLADSPVDRDTIPPTTIKIYGEPHFTNGTKHWITADTPITLLASDFVIDGEPGSGVASTHYRVWYDGTWTDWHTYTGPFTMRDIGLQKDCLHKIEYYSIDSAGNVEWWEERSWAAPFPPVGESAMPFDAYTDVAVDPFGLRTLHTVGTEGLYSRGEVVDPRLVYRMSPDLGDTWTPLVALVTGLAEASEPDVQIGPDGDIHVVFIGYQTGQQQRISHLWYDFSDNGYSYDNATDPANWKPRVLVDDTGRDNVYPQIAIDSGGNVHCVWIGDSDGTAPGGAQDIFYSSFDGAAWGPRTTLYASATNTPGWPNPQIIADQEDDLHVVFLDSGEHMMKYLTYRTGAEPYPITGTEDGVGVSGWGSYYDGSGWNPGVADNVGGSSASYGTIAGLAVKEGALHIAWQDVRDGEGRVYENTRDLMATGAFGPEHAITGGASIDDDGMTVGETLLGSGQSDNLHLFYRDSKGYDVWYMENRSTWSTPLDVADSGPAHLHLWSEMTVDGFDGPLLTYTKADNDLVQFSTFYRQPYHNQIVFVDNTPPETDKKEDNGTITLEGRDNCHCEKHAILVAGEDSRPVVQDGFNREVDRMEQVLKQKCKETGGWHIQKLTGDDATKQAVIEAFAKVEEVAKAGRCCQFLFYFKDHGSGYHKDYGLKKGKIDTTCASEPGEALRESDFKLKGHGYYDTDGDGGSDMFFDSADNRLWKGHVGKDPSTGELKFVKDKMIGEDTQPPAGVIDSADGGADLNGDGDKDDTFCVNEDLCLHGADLYDDELADLIASLCKCRNTVVILDCCFSGGFIDDIKRKKKDNIVIATAAPEDRYAYAKVKRDATGKIAGYDYNYYSHYLRQGLNAGLSVEEAHKRTQDKIRGLSGLGVPVPPDAYDSDPKENKFLYCCGVGQYRIHHRIWHDGVWGEEQIGALNEPVTFSLTEPGDYVVEYWSVDELGNAEDRRSQPHPTPPIPGMGVWSVSLTAVAMSALAILLTRRRQAAKQT